MLAHLGRAGGAVDADDVGPHGVEGGQRGADLGAEQHAAGGLDGDLDLERDLAARRRPWPGGQPIMAALARSRSNCGLDEEQVDAALEQAVRPAPRRRRAARRSGSGRARRTWCPGRSSRPRSAGGPAVEYVGGHLAGDAGGGHGSARGPARRCRTRRAATAKAPKRVGLDDVDADLEVLVVHAGDDVGPGDARGSRCSPRGRAPPKSSAVEVRRPGARCRRRRRRRRPGRGRRRGRARRGHGPGHGHRHGCRTPVRARRTACGPASGRLAAPA